MVIERGISQYMSGIRQKVNSQGPDPPHTLHIHLLGIPRVFPADSTCPIVLPPSVLRLLSYLLLKGEKAHSRNAIIGDLWGEMGENKARSCLRTAIWRLRNALEPTDALRERYLIGLHRNEIGFNWKTDFWLDTARFEDTIASVLSLSTSSCDESAIQNLDAALSLYTGDLLEGYFDEWIIEDRERFLGLFLQGLQRRFLWSLARDLPDEAIACGCAILARDPYREDIRREIQELKKKHGHPSGAHGSAPEKDPCGGLSPIDIRFLFDTLDKNHGGNKSEASRLGKALLDDLRTAMERIFEAVSGIEDAQDRLARLLRLIEAHVRPRASKGSTELHSWRLRIRKR